MQPAQQLSIDLIDPVSTSAGYNLTPPYCYNLPEMWGLACEWAGVSMVWAGVSMEWAAALWMDSSAVLGGGG